MADANPQSTQLIPLAVPFQPRVDLMQSVDTDPVGKDCRLVNCLHEQTESGKSAVKRYGLSFSTFIQAAGATGLPQGMFLLFGQPYAVWGGIIYSQIGTIFPIPGLPPGVFDVAPGAPGGLPSVVLRFPTGLYIVQYSSSNVVTITQVTDINYPSVTSRGLVELDGTYYVLTLDFQIRGSALQDPTTWPALNFIAPDIYLGLPQAIGRHLNYLLCLSTQGTQFYYDSGASVGSPLLPVGNASWTTGIGDFNGQSLVEYSDTTMFIAQNANGGLFIVQYSGLAQTRISTPWVEKLLVNVSVRNAYGIHTMGHDLYVLTFYSSGTLLTLVYDLGHQQWSQWTSSSSGMEQTYFAGMTQLPSQFGGVLLQNSITNTVDLMQVSLYMDKTEPIFARVVTPNITFNSLHRKRFGVVNLHADTVDTPLPSGATGTIQVSHTDDDYQTFSIPRSIDLTSQRKQLQRNGSSRRRAWQFLHTDSTPLRLWYLEVAAEGGSS